MASRVAFVVFPACRTLTVAPDTGASAPTRVNRRVTGVPCRTALADAFTVSEVRTGATLVGVKGGTVTAGGRG